MAPPLLLRCLAVALPVLASAGLEAAPGLRLPPSTIAAPPSQCPLGLPGAVLRAHYTVKSFQHLPSQSMDPVGVHRELARLALRGDPATIGEEVSAENGYFLLAVDGTSELSITESRAEQDEHVVQVEAMLCNAAEVMSGPAGAYRRALSLQAALEAPKMRWAAWATDLGELWRAEAVCREDAEECHINPQALGEYFSMMGDLDEEKELIASRSSALNSRISVWRFGRNYRLILDGVVMSDTRDEHIYHEMLVHPALLAVDAPREVLIIGGGEGATLREVLKDDRVQRVDMVEIDEGLVGICREHLPAMHQGSFESPRVKLHFEDGANFLRDAANSSFDVVIVDGIDFQEDESYGNVLFSLPLYSDVFRVLRKGGILSQYMSHVERAAIMKTAGFSATASFVVDVPTFLGAGARFTVARKGGGGRLRDELQERVAEMAPSLAGQRWSYLDTEKMALSLEHTGRRLKSYSAGSPGYGSWGVSNRMGPTAFGSHFLFAGFVISHTRRRRGMWADSHSDGCSYAQGASSGAYIPSDSGLAVTTTYAWGSSVSSPSDSGLAVTTTYALSGSTTYDWSSSVSSPIWNDRRLQDDWGSNYDPFSTTTGAPLPGVAPGQTATTPLPPAADGSVPTLAEAPQHLAETYADQLCHATVGDDATCHRCDECSDDSCITSIPRCDEFLSQLYAGCMQETDLAGDIFGTLFQVIFFSCMCWLFCGGCKKKGDSTGPIGPQQNEMMQQRAMMNTENGPGLSGTWSCQGTYQEGGQENQATYDLTTDQMGNFGGTCHDADGANQVLQGKILWPRGQQGGTIAWLEVRGEVQSEFQGTIAGTGPNTVYIQAHYVSNYGGVTTGNIQLRGQCMSAPSAPLMQNQW